MNPTSKLFVIFFASTIFMSGCTSLQNNDKQSLVIKDQGSFAIGGRVVTQPGVFDPMKQGAYNPAGSDPTGQTLHGDHAYVFYQIPEKARKLPLIFWHGGAQFSKTWESTPDGREGFQNIFLRRSFPVYLVDQPRRGNAGRTTQGGTIAAAPDEQMLFGLFRLGIWPNFHDGVQFSRDPEALNQFFRQVTPDTGPRDMEANIVASTGLLSRIGDAVLVTHSASGNLGWRTVLKSDKVRAVVSYEPGGDFIFPLDENIEPMKLGPRTIEPVRVPLSDFLAFTKIPIVIYYGDNIPDEQSTHPALEQWRVFRRVAQQWADVVNRHGGNVTVVQLPKMGIKGNTHFPFSDLNNVQIADLLSQFLSQYGLD